MAAMVAMGAAAGVVAAVSDTRDFYCEEVLSGRTPVDVVAESERALAFRHTQPAFPVHIVVISRLHLPEMTELEDWGTLDDLIRLVREVAISVSRERGGCRIVVNVGSYQRSGHLHWHVIAGDKGEEVGPSLR
jgi:histidine triad (HIT) family protein